MENCAIPFLEMVCFLRKDYVDETVVNEAKAVWNKLGEVKALTLNRRWLIVYAHKWSSGLKNDDGSAF